MTDFIEWLDSNEPSGFENVYCLYRAVVDANDWGEYKGTRNDRGWTFVKGPEGPSLALVSEKAQHYFLRLIQRRYMDGDGPDSMNPEGWYAFMHAMAKDD